MDNKQQIQANNAELEKHKQDILSLPMADDVKNGKYVWKKYEYTPAETIQVINPKSTLTYYKSDSFKVSSDDYNVNSVDISFFNGFTLAVAKYDQHIINDGYVTINGGNFEVVYDKTNAILTVKGVTYSSSDSGTLNYNGIKTYEKEEKIGGLIGYTVSDLETAYPDGGEKDGFWWDKIDLKAMLTVQALNCSKFAVDKFVPAKSAAANQFYIPHSLGFLPRYVLITTALKEFSVDSTQNTIIDVITAVREWNSNLDRPDYNTDYAAFKTEYHYFYKDGYTTSQVWQSAPSKLRADIKQLRLDESSLRFKAGLEYTVFTAGGEK